MTIKEEQQAIDEEEYRLALEEERWKEQEVPEDTNEKKVVDFAPEFPAPKLTDVHRQKLVARYGLPVDRVDYWVGKGVLRSIDKEEAEKLLISWHDLQSGGILIMYLGCDAFLVRLDEPVLDKNRKKLRYLGPPKQPCALFNPEVNLETEPVIYITEGPLKALCGFEHGLPILALAGLWNWLNGPDNLPDEERLLQELKRDWSGKNFVLLTDSDIVPGHPAYDNGAFQRLAKVLYHYGAEEVKIVALPDLTPDEKDPETGKSKKTGLDEFVIAKGGSAITELRELVVSTDPQPHWTLDRKLLLKLAEKPTSDFDTLLLNVPYFDVLLNDYIEHKETFSSELWTKLKKAKLQDITGLKESVKKNVREAKKIKIDGKSIVATAPVELGYEIPAKLLEGSV